jgi:hypothetical protein
VLPFRVDRHRLAGSRLPAAPTAQGFWVSRSSGTDAAVNWKVRDGDYRVVVMNADGSRGVATDTKAGVRIPWLPGVGVGILGGGLLLLGGGIVAIVLGAQRPPAAA